MKNQENMVLKNICFFNIVFSTFFGGFWQFWMDFGRLGGFQKSIKNRKNRVRDAFDTRLRFLILFGKVLGSFGEVLGKF